MGASAQATLYVVWVLVNYHARITASTTSTGTDTAATTAVTATCGMLAGHTLSAHVLQRARGVVHLLGKLDDCVKDSRRTSTSAGGVCVCV
jgi:hypothetical protein